MDVEREIHMLAAETLALQTLLVGFLNTVPSEVAAQAFDYADKMVENITIKAGVNAAPEHSLGAVKILETLRIACVKPHTKPGHGI